MYPLIKVPSFLFPKKFLCIVQEIERRWKPYREHTPAFLEASLELLSQVMTTLLFLHLDGSHWEALKSNLCTWWGTSVCFPGNSWAATLTRVQACIFPTTNKSFVRAATSCACAILTRCLLFYDRAKTWPKSLKHATGRMLMRSDRFIKHELKSNCSSE